MKSKFDFMDAIDIRREYEISGRAEDSIYECAIKFQSRSWYYHEKNPLFLKIKNEIEKININRDAILEYVLGESYKQRDKTIYITSRFENEYFFFGYGRRGIRDPNFLKKILISAIYCSRTVIVPLPRPVKLTRRSKSFWQNLRIDWFNAKEEAIFAKTGALTNIDIFFICLATFEKILTTNEE